MTCSRVELQDPRLACFAVHPHHVLRVPPPADVETSGSGGSCRCERDHVARPETNGVAPRRGACRIGRRQVGYRAEIDAREVIAQSVDRLNDPIDTSLDISRQDAVAVAVDVRREVVVIRQARKP